MVSSTRRFLDVSVSAFALRPLLLLLHAARACFLLRCCVRCATRGVATNYLSCVAAAGSTRVAPCVVALSRHGRVHNALLSIPRLMVRGHVLNTPFSIPRLLARIRSSM